jgi:hypothetical protein
MEVSTLSIRLRSSQLIIFFSSLKMKFYASYMLNNKSNHTWLVTNKVRTISFNPQLKNELFLELFCQLNFSRQNFLWQFGKGKSFSLKKNWRGKNQLGKKVF